jgi:hypothetical protein
MAYRCGCVSIGSMLAKTDEFDQFIRFREVAVRSKLIEQWIERADDRSHVRAGEER